jgi:late competence protein required for DNA uptake (superfamily II DNA/RNA helicase)
VLIEREIGMAEEKEATETKTAPAAKSEGRPKNCSFCNKVLKPRSWYYRNGKYYCKKKCWIEERKKIKKA